MFGQTKQKPLPLEQQLENAKSEVKLATILLKEAHERIAAELREAKAKEAAAQSRRDQADRALRSAEAATKKRLGLQPGKVKRAVLAWAGLKPGEEREAVIRGREETLDHAVKHIIDDLAARDPIVRAAEQALRHAERAHEPVRRLVVEIERKTDPEYRRLSRANGLVATLTEKIRERDNRKASKEIKREEKKITKADENRFVEARRRLGMVNPDGRYYSLGDARTLLKLDPPFEWPVKGKVKS